MAAGGGLPRAELHCGAAAIAAGTGHGAAACTARAATRGGRGEVRADVEAQRRAAMPRAVAPPAKFGGGAPARQVVEAAACSIGIDGGAQLGIVLVAEAALGDTTAIRGDCGRRPHGQGGSGAGVTDRPRRAVNFGDSGRTSTCTGAGSGADIAVEGPTGTAPGGKPSAAWLGDGCSVHTDDVEALAPASGRADTAGDCGNGGGPKGAGGRGERFAGAPATAGGAQPRSAGDGEERRCACC